MSCGCNKMVGGSLASDMVMSTVQGQHDEPYDFLPSAECGDTTAFKGVNQTAGSLAKSMIKKHKKMMRNHSKKSKSKKHSKRRSTPKSHRKSHRKSHKMSMKNISQSGEMEMMGGGSDWAASQYSQGPINNSGDLSSYFSKNKPSSRNSLLNPPNLASAGSGASMDFYGSGYPV